MEISGNRLKNDVRYFKLIIKLNFEVSFNRKKWFNELWNFLMELKKEII